MKHIYMDHNATTPIAPEVLEAMLPFMREGFGNASSMHWFGRQVRTALDSSRERIADYLGCDPKEVVFTSGGTESDNAAVLGTVLANTKRGNHIITSAVEHHAVINPVRKLEKQGFRVTVLSVDSHGLVDPDAVREALAEDTVLVSIMYANNEVGTVQPIAQIGSMLREKGVLFHTDAVQGAGKFPLKVDDLGVDLLTMTAHKIYGPKGIGLLYIRKGVKIEPLIIGGHHERNRRAGTENVAGIVGFAAAVDLAERTMHEENERVSGLRDRLQQGILEKIEHVSVNGHPEKRTPNTLNVSFHYIEGEGILLGLDMEGIAVSSGSACTSGELEPSHVLLAMKVPVDIAQGGLRFSLGRDNTEQDVDHAIDVLGKVVPRLRSMSPLYDKFLKGEYVAGGAGDDHWSRYEHVHHVETDET